MLEERMIDLIQRDLDRETDPDERLELRQRLEHDPDARLYFDQMLSVTALLERTPLSEPPTSFTAAVMHGVRAHAAQGGTERGRVVRPLFGIKRDRFVVLRIGMGLAAAAAIVFAFVLAPSLFHALDSSHLRGSMVAPTESEVARNWAIVVGPGAKIRANATRERVTIRFDGPAGAERHADVVFDASQLRIESIEGAMESESAPGKVHIAVEGSSAVLRFDRSTAGEVALSVHMHGPAQKTITTRIEIPAATNF